MRIIKHFVDVAKALTQRLFCKHTESSISSCPFTGRTYTTCLKCFKRLNVEVTK
jgi:4-hydroxy-3-methylbut-2-en-1-yl diphosphate synthase IspG/GcpE